MTFVIKTKIYSKPPKNLEIDLPKKQVIESPKVVDNSEDSLTQNERLLKKVWIVILFLCGFAILSLFGNENPKSKHHEVIEAVSPTNISSLPQKTISVKDLENTIRPGKQTSPELPIEGGKKSKYKVGDQVGPQYQTQGQSFSNHSNGFKRNFDTPLQVVTNKEAQYGSFSAPKLLIPKDAYIRGYLDREVSTGNMNIPVTATTYMDLNINGKVIIPEKSKLIGKAYQDRNSQRIGIYFNYVVLPNTKEYSIKALALGEDNIVGLAGDMDHKVPEKSVDMVASSILSAASTSARISGSSFGSTFANDLAGQTADSFDDGLENQANQYQTSIRVPISTKFKVVFY